MNSEILRDGWYLMSPADLEIELRRYRSGAEVEPSNALRLEIDQALAYRNEGNLPDELGRTLRLALHVGTIEELRSLDERRARYEPDFHEAPTWRRPGSKPVNVVPLRAPDVVADDAGSWMDDEDMAELEGRWRADGRVHDVRVPAEYRAFIFKTVVSLQGSGRPITIDTIVDSLSRWLQPAEVEEIRSALEAANR